MLLLPGWHRYTPGKVISFVHLTVIVADIGMKIVILSDLAI